MQKNGVLFLFLFLSHCLGLVHSGLSTEQVIEEVEKVFHLVDEGTLKNQGDAALPKLQPIFQRFPMMHCPSFTMPAAWPSNDTRTLSTCLYAVLGGLVMGNVTFSEGDMQEFAQCRYNNHWKTPRAILLTFLLKNVLQVPFGPTDWHPCKRRCSQGAGQRWAGHFHHQHHHDGAGHRAAYLHGTDALHPKHCKLSKGLIKR